MFTLCIKFAFFLPQRFLPPERVGPVVIMQPAGLVLWGVSESDDALSALVDGSWPHVSASATGTFSFSTHTVSAWRRMVSVILNSMLYVIGSLARGIAHPGWRGLVVVCTHIKRDARCATCGPPVLKAVRRVCALQSMRTSHE